MRSSCFSAWLLSAHCLLAAPAIPLTVTETAGVPRAQEIVTSGVPFPIGVISNANQVRLVDERGTAVPAQIEVLGTWRDGSVKWALLDFPVSVAAHGTAGFRLEYGPSGLAPAPQARIGVREFPDHFQVDTARLRFSVPRQQPGPLREVQVLTPEGRWELRACGLSSYLDGRLELAPEEVVVEEAGPLRAVIKVRGKLAESGRPPVFEYRWRMTAWANSSAIRAQWTLTHLGRTNKLELVRTFGLRLALAETNAPTLFGGEPAPHVAAAGAAAQIDQLAEGQYQFRQGTNTQTGLQCPGWLAEAGVLAMVQHFWQQYPKALHTTGGQVDFALYPENSPAPFDWDQGLAKTHTLFLEFAAPAEAGACTARATGLAQPLFAVAPPAWYANSQVFGDLAPFNFDLFPDYETLTEASGDKFIKSMSTGLRNWGDFYYGGEYKGKNAFMNLEYDITHNFLVQFARTGQRKYLDAARVMARHQADIDINHFTGWQWKHSPRHTETQAEFGHTFLRGLIEHYCFTGERGSREAAVTLADFFAKDIRNPRSLGNERQIGWSFISLLPAYEATWDQKYFIAAQEAMSRLLAGLDERGKFDIRWDNRIAFMNGIAATGFIYFHRATGDERVADAALKVIRRTLGMYPEYNGRTLEALAWAYRRTSDPVYLDALKLSYEATMARALAANSLELGAPTIFTVHALPFMEQSGLVKAPACPFGLTPAQFASENGRYAHHLPAGNGELHLQVSGREPFDLMVVRKGAWKEGGTATLYDPFGAVAARVEFPRTAALWQREIVCVKPARAGTWRLALRVASTAAVKGSVAVTWDAVTSRPLPAVLHTERHAGLEFLTPRLYSTPLAGADKIEIELVGEGEGFKKATLYDPTGKPAAAVHEFIDLGDTGRYLYKMSAPISPAQAAGIWSLSLQDVSVSKLTGMRPYFATSPEAFFRVD